MKGLPVQAGVDYEQLTAPCGLGCFKSTSMKPGTPGTMIEDLPGRGGTGLAEQQLLLTRLAVVRMEEPGPDGRREGTA
jgi:hypothetical protein